MPATKLKNSKQVKQVNPARMPCLTMQEANERVRALLSKDKSEVSVFMLLIQRVLDTARQGITELDVLHCWRSHFEDRIEANRVKELFSKWVCAMQQARKVELVAGIDSDIILLLN